MIKSYFRKFISFESIMPFAIVLVVVALVLHFLGSKTPGFKTRRKKYYVYLAANIVVMALFVAIIYNLKQSSLLLRYFSMLGFATIMGVANVFFHRTIFEKFDTHQKLKELVFAIISGLALMVPIIMIAAHFNDLQYLPYYFLVIAAYVFPTSFFILYAYSISIPAKLYTKWYYPMGNKYDAPKHYELNNMIVLNFMFYKNANSPNMTSFKAKAPKDMDFGRLFYFFINDYNNKKTTTKIEVTSNSDDPHGWYFYSKPKWYGTSKHIDPERTVEENNLKDSDTVVCQRI
ncbi:TssN family type VI secretion system protein [Zobellia uliginosa]|uniref:TssN family type VI secretion system protein n=1 Tax=Zobellia uliginosa TaxID=143224 RepID=UPI0026E259FB|nr:TssN family type VI secretion system protein [Zobellia uliginosa]MDO6519057.1 TssN family type VI secretion system protein [Zobellia uliginosa]